MALVTWVASPTGSQRLVGALSEGDLRLTGSTEGTNGFAEATLGRSTGKYYFELLLLHPVAPPEAGYTYSPRSVAVGFIEPNNHNFPAFIHLGENTGTFKFQWSLILYGAKFDAHNNVLVNRGSYVYAPGDVIGCAIDMDANKIWFAYNNVWVSGDPAAGTTPSFSAGDAATNTTFIPCVTTGAPGGPVGGPYVAVVEGHFGLAHLKYAVPSGFFPWSEDAASTGAAAGTSTAECVPALPATGLANREVSCGRASDGATATALNLYGVDYAAGKAIDGPGVAPHYLYPLYPSTPYFRGSVTNPAEHLTVTLASPKLVSKIIVWSPYSSYDFAGPGNPGDATTTLTTGVPYNFTIETLSGTTWALRATITANTLAKRVITFDDINLISAVRMKCTTALADERGVFGVTTLLNTTFTQWYVQELEVFEFEVLAGGISTALAVGVAARIADGSVDGTSDAVAYSGISTGLAEGTSAAISFNNSGIGLAEGTSTAEAVGVTASVGVGTAVGQCLVEGTPTLLVVTNVTSGMRIHPWQVYPSTQVTFVETGTDLTQLKNGDVNGSVYLTYNPSASPANVYDGRAIFMQYIGSPVLANKLVIYSSTLPDRSDELAYGTFGLGDSGLIGNVDEDLTIEIVSNLAFLRISVHANRNTALEVEFSPRSISSIAISGPKIINAHSALLPTTILSEIQLLSTKSIVSGIEVSTANVVSIAIPIQHIFASSTANVTSAASGFETQTEVSTAHITSSVDTQTDITLELVSTANATSSADGKQTLILVSTADATSTVLNPVMVSTFVSTANVTSSAEGLITRVETLVSTANVTSSAEGVLSYTVVSTADITSIVDGTRIVLETAVSTANVTSSVDGSSNSVTLTLVSTANITSVVDGSVFAHETCVSTADIRSYVLLPGLSAGLAAIWCNPVTQAAASWSGTPFESVIEVDGVMYGAGVGGIYIMEDVLEEDVEIDSYVTWDLLDFGDPKKHRPGDFIINGSSGAPLKVTVVNEQGRWDYPTHLPKNTKTTNFRAQLGKGLNSRHLRFTVSNTKSKEFWFDGAEIEVIQLTRHIGGRHG